MRRSRIKAVVNIPLGRKADKPKEDVPDITQASQSNTKAGDNSTLKGVTDISLEVREASNFAQDCSTSAIILENTDKPKPNSVLVSNQGCENTINLLEVNSVSQNDLISTAAQVETKSKINRRLLTKPKLNPQLFSRTKGENSKSSQSKDDSIMGVLEHIIPTKALSSPYDEVKDIEGSTNLPQPVVDEKKVTEINEGSFTDPNLIPKDVLHATIVQGVKNTQSLPGANIVDHEKLELQKSKHIGTFIKKQENCNENLSNSTTFERRLFKPKISKSILTNINFKLLTNTKRTPTDKKDHLSQEAFHSLSDNMQLNELEISSVNEPNLPLENDKGIFVKPSVNFNVSKMWKEDNLGDSSCLKSGVSHSDVEQNIMPPSPVKMIGRSRIKAVPRLGQRRISSSIHGSASESEDDVSKKYKQIRTDSALSSIVAQESNIDSDAELFQKLKNAKTFNQRRCVRSEQSRKIAEARRNFTLKFGKSTPDKQKLTMMDLIFYNPCNNPMSQKSPQKQSTSTTKEDTIPNSVEEEVSIEVDDKEVSIEVDDKEEEEEDDILAPQIKIGVNGEIIIDEQSLVIENSQTRKTREEIQKSDIIDADFDTGYGVFKRVKRTKDWSKLETVHFYKALNTLGTDFTLMSEFFHNRTRRDLKMKFKKEERMNLSLIDKALSQPPQFDMTELRQDFEKYKKLLDDLENDELLNKSNKRSNKSQKEISELVATLKKKRKKGLYSRLEKGPVSVGESTSDEGEVASKNQVNTVAVKKKNGNTRKRNKPTSSDDDYTGKNEVANILKPTRSGRVPKPTQNCYMKTTASEKSPDFTRLQPGSLVIVTCPTSTGEQAYKVFMVTNNNTQVPVSLTNSVVQNISLENNITIPAVVNTPEDMTEHAQAEAIDNETVILQQERSVVCE